MRPPPGAKATVPPSPFTTSSTSSACELARCRDEGRDGRVMEGLCVQRYSPTVWRQGPVPFSGNDKAAHRGFSLSCLWSHCGHKGRGPGPGSSRWIEEKPVRIPTHQYRGAERHRLGRPACQRDGEVGTGRPVALTDEEPQTVWRKGNGTVETASYHKAAGFRDDVEQEHRVVTDSRAISELTTSGTPGSRGRYPLATQEIPRQRQPGRLLRRWRLNPGRKRPPCR
jgi:hypothetical protein